MRKLPVKRGQGCQFAALPFIEKDGETMVMLVTSRETKRWVLPKGWAEKGLSGPELAAKEAFEEAGLRGEIAAKRVGSYTYEKHLPDGEVLDCRVDIFPLHVTKLLDDWPESRQRERKWFTFAQAAVEVQEGELVILLLRLGAPPAA